MARNKIIIDTDPGIDDVLAMLLAFTAKAEDLEVLLLSVSYGNVEVQSCLKNVMSMFKIIGEEMDWRKRNGRPQGFECLTASKPLVAAGALRPLADQLVAADYYHGADGLGGVSSTHPHLSPDETWRALFSGSAGQTATETTVGALFRASSSPAQEEILRLLRENEQDTITIAVIGPMTNVAQAAAADPETFLRVKEVVVMGGAVEMPGNITPVSEFNFYADSYAAARVLALTSPNPSSTMPPTPLPAATTSKHPTQQGWTHTSIDPYPDQLSRQLKLTLMSLDITTRHLLHSSAFKDAAAPFLGGADPSPLAEWTSAFLTSIFAKIESAAAANAPQTTTTDPSPTPRDAEAEALTARHASTASTAAVPAPGLTADAQDDSTSTPTAQSTATKPADLSPGLHMHDPLCIWYALTHLTSPSNSKWRISSPQDIRVETAGRWTRGMCVTDARGRPRKNDSTSEGDGDGTKKTGAGTGTVAGSIDGWLDQDNGNRVRRVLESPGEGVFERELLGALFG